MPVILEPSGKPNPIDTIERVIKAVFSENAAVYTVTRPTLNEDPHHVGFWCVFRPNGDLRWLVPIVPKHFPTLSQNVVSVLQSWKPYGSLSSLAWCLFKAAYLYGNPSCIPGVVPVTIRIPDKIPWLSPRWSDQQTPWCLVYVGTPCPTQKLVVFLTEKQSGNVTGIAKIPLGEASQKTIVHEAHLLQRLHQENPGYAPELIQLDTDHAISLQTALIARPTSMTFTDAHLTFLLAMKRHDHPVALFDVGNALIKRIKRIQGIETLNTKIDRSALDAVERMIQVRFNETRAPSCWVHGDFVPWNLKQANNGRLMAIDWEEGLVDGLPMADLFHFFWMPNFLRPAAFRKQHVLSHILKHPLVKRYQTATKLDQPLTETLYVYYLLDYGCRQVEQGDYGKAEKVFKQTLSELAHWLKEFA